VLSGRGLCDELITRPEESYRLWCVVVCDLETSRIGAPYIYGISSLRVNVHGSVHRNNIPIYIQQDATLQSLFYLETALHVSGGTTTHHQERIQLSTASGICHTVTATCRYRYPVINLRNRCIWLVDLFEKCFNSFYCP